jgi:N utilization substance protein B
MISRRNIRVKVMQTLYTMASLEHGAQGNKQAAARILDEKLGQVLDLFTVTVLHIVKIAQYADLDARLRASKYLPTAEDLKVDIRVATNTFVTRILSNVSFQERVEKDKLERFIEEDWVKKVYQSLAKSAEYLTYTAAPEHTAGADKEIMRYIWEKQVLENENLLSHFNDELPGWEDDADLIIILMQNFFNGGQKINFANLLSGEKKEYARELMMAVIEKEMFCMELIEPKLNNWDKERVALIDLLLLRMGVCEFLYFPTIPTKVTINEYIDIAKQYSTPQSGQFVNGVLDNILKELVKENKVRKIERPGAGK